MFCQKCGNQLIDGAQFCDKCGQPLGANVAPVVQSQSPLVLPASAMKRLANFIIDRITKFILMPVFFVIAIIFFSGVLRILVEFLSVILFFGYNLICESIWQKTLGKVITNTEGNKPSFWKILGRSLSRYIPFEPFSFLFSGFPVGWHDSLSGTLVVASNLTPEEVKKINVEEVRKQNHHNPAVVIVVIVVGLLGFVAIIGILASVVLSSLNVARQKGADAMIKSELMNVRVEAELYYNQNGNNHYLGVCTDTNLRSTLSQALMATGDPQADYACYDTSEAWAVSTPLKTEGYWCVDSVGNSNAIESRLSGATSCPVM